MAQRQTLTIKKQKQQKTPNLSERGESDFQSHHIIRFKYLAFNNNNKKDHRAYKDTRKYGSFRGKKINKLTLSLKKNLWQTN